MKGYEVGSAVKTEWFCLCSRDFSAGMMLCSPWNGSAYCKYRIGTIDYNLK